MRIGLLETSYRRRALDRDLQRVCKCVGGRVIDMGGENVRRRGRFKPPHRPDLQWMCVNIDRSELPDVLANVERMPFVDGCAHAVVCTEVLEHVEQPARVISESFRLLRPGGLFIGSMPFMYRVHADPFDFQRYTKSKLSWMLADAGYQETEIFPQGFFFTVMAEMIRDGLNQIRRRLLRWPLALVLLPLLKISVHLDGSSWVQDSTRLSSYTTGYFIRAIKGDDAEGTPAEKNGAYTTCE